ncbi:MULTISPECIES: prepilin-type N-terminal cleavage/methylation domain-containing protein [unclassified Bradyrhizobium]|uniref:prepilin-type N-terminal cleavage/methylation domain-containing protein n=1 Tax=unclassified Bradyrhizobium TaxID=2631580 RepID=UPI0028F0E911|nr:MULTISPECIES: prepilin-type N-terminal cleavage/methylation domain-containing protein [unclassified Bradyrhizobium]
MTSPKASGMDDRDAGFTLVEVLVALALFSLLAVLLFDSVKFGVQAWRSGSARAESFQRELVAQDVLRRLIGNLYPMMLGEGAAQRRIDVDGQAESLEFLSDAPAVSGGAGRFRFKLFADRRRDGGDLVLQSRPELAVKPDTERTLLVSDIDRIELSYAARATGDASPAWSTSWKDQSEAPGLIRLRVLMRPGDARHWPELVIAPRVQADVACVYDALTMRCRGR